MSIGNIEELEISKVFEWRIPNFLSLLDEADESYDSPEFSFAGQSWYLSVFPNGYEGNETVGYIGIYLYCESSDPDTSLKYSIKLKTLKGIKDTELYCTSGFGAPELILRSELLSRKSELLPSDVLTVLCTLKYSNGVEDKSDDETIQCSYCKETLDPGRVSSHEKRCLNKPIKCPECSAVIALKKWYKHKCPILKPKGDISLSQDYKKILLNGRNHDLILKVGNKELRVHQDILRVRSPVFESMLNHDMVEKQSGIINVTDCDPEAMEMFVSYIYCGKVEKLNQNNMLKLYYIADKYNMQGLKEECCNFIKGSLSCTNICEIIQLALDHSDSGLLEYAKEYFMDNTIDIMVTMEWQSFLINNPTLGNELLIQSFRKVKKRKLE